MYKRGDIIITSDGVVYEILRHLPNADAYESLDNNNKRYKIISRRDILCLYSDIFKCPICKEKWKVTRSPVLNTEWKDCIKCGKTKEEIEKIETKKKDDELTLFSKAATYVRERASFTNKGNS